MMTRLKIELTPTEYELLFQMANAELRSPGDHLRYLLRQEIQRQEPDRGRNGLPAMESKAQPPVGHT